jgi:hypothetical protein
MSKAPITAGARHAEASQTQVRSLGCYERNDAARECFALAAATRTAQGGAPNLGHLKPRSTATVVLPPIQAGGYL